MINPGLAFYIFAFIMCFTSKKTRNILSILLIFVSFFMFINMQDVVKIAFAGYEFTFRKTLLSAAFYYVFLIISLSGFIYSFTAKKIDFIVAVLYAGSAISLLFSDDSISFFIFWEMMAISSTFLIFIGGGTKPAIRYAIIHILGGTLLISGFVTGNDRLVLLSFLINLAAFPFNAWLVDGYPASSIYGGVFLSAFTTKSAVYAIAKFFPGDSILIYTGAIMAVYGVLYAVIENDIRRVLSYHIISQVGYMVCGVGLGSIGGATSHAFTHIIYKGLLFMSAGSIIYATGKRKITELGGLIDRIPSAFIFLLIGGLSITGFPLFSSFVSKTIIVHESEKLKPVFYMLEFASIGTCLTFTKLPFYIFFGERKSIEANPLPLSMISGMSIAAFFSIAIGLFPRVFYRLMPESILFNPYKFSNVIETILFYSGVILAFFTFRKLIKPTDTITLDTDWFYRKLPVYFVPLVEIISSIKVSKILFHYLPRSITSIFSCIYNSMKENEIEHLVASLLIAVSIFIVLFLL